MATNRKRAKVRTQPGSTERTNPHNNKASRRPEKELELDVRGYPTGEDGTVWATYDLRQAETIRNALMAQHIGCTLKKGKPRRKVLYLLHIGDEDELEEAMDFIWREVSGLRLQPDWHYAMGRKNESFDKWISGT